MNAKKDGSAATESVIENETDALSASIIYGLGGKDNIVDVDSCATRLRTTIANSDLVDVELLKSTGAAGVVQKGTGVQVVYGPKVSNIKSNLEEFIESGKAAKLPSKEDFYGQAAVEETVVVAEDVIETEETAAKDLAVIGTIQSPMAGNLIPLSEVPDAAFSSAQLVTDLESIQLTEK